MATITTRITDALDFDLNKVAKIQDRNKSYIINKAIEEYVIEAIEDAEDIATAEEVLKNSTGNAIPLEEIEAKYGLAD